MGSGEGSPIVNPVEKVAVIVIPVDGVTPLFQSLVSLEDDEGPIIVNSVEGGSYYFVSLVECV